MKKFILISLSHLAVISFSMLACQDGYQDGSTYVQSTAAEPTHILKLEYDLLSNVVYILNDIKTGAEVRAFKEVVITQVESEEFSMPTIPTSDFFPALISGNVANQFPQYHVELSTSDDKNCNTIAPVYVTQNDAKVVCVDPTQTNAEGTGETDNSDSNQESTPIDSSTTLRLCTGDEIYKYTNEKGEVEERKLKEYYLDCAYAKTADYCKVKLKEKPGCEVPENLVDLSFCLDRIQQTQDYYAKTITADDPRGAPDPKGFCSEIGIR